jgi:hypothetical protein
MKVGMEKYATQDRLADFLLFDPAREDVDLFLARIFSYAQRRRLCALAFDSTRSYLRCNAGTLAPRLARHGLALRRQRIDDTRRDVCAALSDPRPLHAGALRRRSVKTTARDLEHTLVHLERQLALLRAR